MIDELLSRFRAADSVVVATHVRPDGDALGSQVGLGLFLERLGKNVHMVADEPPPRTLRWLADPAGVERYEDTPEERARIQEADVIVVVDTNCAERLGSMADLIRESDATKVLIDHHPDPEDWFDICWTREGEAATGQMVYELVEAHGLEVIDAPIAEALYTAIMTDTGSFRYSSVHADVHRAVAELVDRGSLSIEKIHSSIFDRRSLNGLRLLGRAFESIELAYGGRLGYMSVTYAMVNSVESTMDETDGFIDYVLSVEGVEIAVLFKEAPEGTKMSFRSKGTWPVNKWAQQFGGGGHRNASGAYVEGDSMEAVIERVIDAAPRHVPQLDPDAEVDGAVTGEDGTVISTYETAS